MKLLRQLSAVVLSLCLLHLPLTSSAAVVAELTARAPLAAAPSFAAPGALLPAPALSSPVLPAALTAAPIASAVPVAAPVAAAPVAAAAPAARAVLAPMSQAAAKSADLAPFYSGSKAASSASEAVSAGAGAPSLGSGLAPASGIEPNRPAKSPAFAPSRQRGSSHVVVLVIVGIVAAAAIAVGVIWHNGQSKNDLWQNSKSNQDIVAVEKARRAGDAEALFTIGKDARVRQKDMNEKIADAKSRGDKKVDDKTGDNLKTAGALATFDGLAGMRAEENANALSKDAARRAGGELPSAWQERVAALDAAARASGDEGSLALELKALRGDLSRDEATASRFASDIKDFDASVPGLFGGRLKDMEKKAEADLAEFNASEVAPERALLAQYDGAMRARVSAKLAAQSPEYQSHLAHLDRLSDASQSVAPALELAQQVDKDLRDMASHEHARQANLLFASQNENVRVDDVDNHGNVVGYHFEDHSSTYKALAASEGAEARASAASAQAGIKALHAILPGLRRDKTLSDEGLTFALPAPPTQQVGQSGSVFFDFWIPASWNLFGSVFTESQAGQARASFAPVLGSLQQVSAEISSRKSGEAGWVNKAVDRDLDRQMANAPKKP